MSIVTRLKTTKEVVKYLLGKYEHYRDEDNRMVAHVWNSELFALGKDAKELSAYDFLIIYSEGKLTAASDIERARRKAQEQYPELRGKKWGERHEQETEVKKEIHTL